MTNKKKILILMGHPDKETVSGFLADSYEKGAKKVGHQVKRVNVGDLEFDPILHKGYKEVQTLEPDLLMVQQSIKWADHLVIVYPNWWGSMPALFKGLFDRMLLPGFAFNFRDGKHLKYLTGKSARVVVTMDVMPKLFKTRTSRTMKNSILNFCGIYPVRISEIGPIKEIIDKKKTEWGEAFTNFGKRGI